jgi:4-hydroxy-2,2'-bipyrrole-5-carbaldehyde O-methyltransferase
MELATRLRAAGAGRVVRSAASRVLAVAGALKGRRGVATALAIADSRRFVRACFLSSAVSSGLLPSMRTPCAFGELVARSRAARPDRLEAWLAVGVELGELGRRGDRYVAAGRRARMLSGRDPLLASHYRSMLEYQLGPYAELADLLGEAPQQGRDDLERHARTIAEVSLAAAPFIVPFLRRTVEHSRPERALDVGCGTGVYLRALLGADPRLGVEGIELAPEVASDTAERLRADGLSHRAAVHVGDVRALAPSSGRGFDLVTLCNSVYYFPRDERVALYRHLGDLLAADGVLLVTTMTWPGSVASAHLHLMLRCQSGSAGLPGSGEVEGDLNAAGFDLLSSEPLVPSEPFVGITARRRTAGKPG